MAKKKKIKIGDLDPLYSFTIIPYPDQRFSSCPSCGKRTGQLKRPLLIYVEPRHSICLNYTCRYCKHCDLLIAHKHDVEHILTNMFMQLDPDAIGNQYLIIGTVEKKAWRENMKNPKGPDAILAQLHDFKNVLSEIRMTQPGWYAPGQKPQIWEPPQSCEWIK
jgi:hypothetical protein